MLTYLTHLPFDYLPVAPVFLSPFSTLRCSLWIPWKRKWTLPLRWAPRDFPIPRLLTWTFCSSHSPLLLLHKPVVCIALTSVSCVYLLTILLYYTLKLRERNRNVFTFNTSTERETDRQSDRERHAYLIFRSAVWTGSVCIAWALSGSVCVCMCVCVCVREYSGPELPSCSPAWSDLSRIKTPVGFLHTHTHTHTHTHPRECECWSGCCFSYVSLCDSSYKGHTLRL